MSHGHGGRRQEETPVLRIQPYGEKTGAVSFHQEGRPELMESESDRVLGNGRAQEVTLQRTIVHVECGCSG